MTAAIALSGSALAQVVKLNGPLVQSGGSITDLAISPDGARIVYSAEQDTSGLFELYSVPADGSGAPVKLNGPMLGDIPYPEVLEPAFMISADSSWVVYRTDVDSADIQVYGVPIDGSAPPVQLDLHPDVGWGYEPTVLYYSPSGERVLLANTPATGLHSSLRVGGAGVTLDPDYVSGYVEFSPDGTRAFYGATTSPISGGWDVRVVPIDGSAPPITLNGPLGSAGSVYLFALAPDGEHVAYRADQETDEVYELFARASDGSGAPIKLNAPLPVGRDVRHFWFDADGDSLVYTVDFGTYVQLYRTPLDGSTSAVPLNSIPVSGPSISTYDFLPLPERGRVLYRSHPGLGRFELFSLSIDGSLPPSRLNGPLVAGGAVFYYAIGAGGARVVYSADALINDQTELFSAAIESRFTSKLRRPETPPQVQLSSEDGGIGGWLISPDGEQVLYVTRQDQVTGDQLRTVPIAGGESVPISDPLPPGRRLSQFLCSADGRVAFISPEGDGAGLYVAPIDASTPPLQLNPPLPLGAAIGDVQAFEISPLGQRALYLADEDEDEVDELYSVRVDGRGAPSKLNAPLVAGGDVGGGARSGEAFVYSPDGLRVAYVADQDTPNLVELYVVPEGGETPTKLSAGSAVLAGQRFTPDGARIVYRALVSATKTGLFSVRADGSEAPRRLDIVTTGSGVVSFQIAPDGARVVYRADEVASRFEVFSVPVDGSASRVRLNDPLGVDRDVESYALSPDGARVCFLADATSDGWLDLFSVPTDRSSAPIEPSASAGNDVAAFVIGPDSARVAYVARYPQSSFRLYAAALDGSTSAVELSGTMVTGGNVVSSPGALAITPDSQRVVFVADRATFGVQELHSVPIDASAAPIRLNANLVAGGDVGAYAGWFALSSDGTRVVYVADQRVDNRPELFTALVLGGGQQQLNPPLAVNREVVAFAIEPNGLHVVYVADQEGDGVPGIYRVPIDASAPAERLNTLFPGLGSTMEFQVTPDSRRVLYRTQGDAFGVVELYSTLADKAQPSDEPPPF